MDVKDAVMSLLEERGAGKTICPSDVARRLASDEDNWRVQMPNVHAAVDELLAAGAIAISWKGVRKERRSGAYRIERGRPFHQYSRG